MALPPLIKDSEPDGLAWRRKVRDLLNSTVQATRSVGASSERPPQPSTGYQHFDTTLGKPIWWHNGAWRDATGASV